MVSIGRVVLVVFGLAMLVLYIELLASVSSIQASLSFEDIPADMRSVVDVSTNSKLANKKILVAYSGPTSLDRSEGKNELYLRNFDFFLEHGVDCQHQDTVIALTESVEQVYRDQLARLDRDCQTRGRRVYTLLRDLDCHDLATVHTLFYNSTVPTRTYDYFVYINCGMTGPAPDLKGSWLLPFVEPLSETVKMSGLSVNCFRKNSPHVQSMAYALDRIGLDIVLESPSIFDCRQEFSQNERNNAFNKIVIRYERGMSKAILEKGYGLASIVWPGVVFWDNRTNCTLIDRWGEANLKKTFGGRLPHLNETIFFKSSRLLPKEIAQLIDYPGEPSWHAER